jgi:hypothetical protein
MYNEMQTTLAWNFLLIFFYELWTYLLECVYVYIHLFQIVFPKCMMIEAHDNWFWRGDDITII